MIKKLEFSLKIINQSFILRNKNIDISKIAVNRIIFCLSKFSKFKTKPVSVKIHTQSVASAIKPPILAKLISPGLNEGKAYKSKPIKNSASKTADKILLTF